MKGRGYLFPGKGGTEGSLGGRTQGPVEHTEHTRPGYTEILTLLPTPHLPEQWQPSRNHSGSRVEDSFLGNMNSARGRTRFPNEKTQMNHPTVVVLKWG